MLGGHRDHTVCWDDQESVWVFHLRLQDEGCWSLEMVPEVEDSDEPEAGLWTVSGGVVRFSLWRMLQTDWQEQTKKQMMEVDLTIYDAGYYLLCSIGVEDNLVRIWPRMSSKLSWLLWYWLGRLLKIEWYEEECVDL